MTTVAVVPLSCRAKANNTQEKGVVFMQVAILALTLLILVVIDEIIKNIKK